MSKRRTDRRTDGTPRCGSTFAADRDPTDGPAAATPTEPETVFEPGFRSATRAIAGRGGRGGGASVGASTARRRYCAVGIGRARARTGYRTASRRRPSAPYDRRRRRRRRPSGKRPSPVAETVATTIRDSFDGVLLAARFRARRSPPGSCWSRRLASGSFTAPPFGRRPPGEWVHAIRR